MLNRMLLANPGKPSQKYDVICYGVSTFQDACYIADDLLTANQVVDIVEDDGIVKFNFQDLENMEEMFYSCADLTSVIISKFDSSNVENIARMFMDCNSINRIDISKFDSSNVKLMHYLFYNCSNLSYLDISTLNTRDTAALAGLFYSCGSNTTGGCTIICPQGLDLSSTQYNQQALYDMFTDAIFTQPIHLRNVHPGLVLSGSSPDDWTLLDLCGGTRGVHYIVDSVR